jgi:hypothetical protein
VCVVCFAGGDAYYSDQLVAPAAALSRYFQGARTVYVVGLGSVAEPGQLVAAEYGWNAAAPGSLPVAGSRDSALAELQASRNGDLQPPELYGPDGLLQKACRRLYGDCGGPLLAELFGPHQPENRPVPMIWHTITREVRRLAGGDVEEACARCDHWLGRRQATSKGIALVRRAMDCADFRQSVREDLAWLLKCLEVGDAFCAALVTIYEALAAPDAASREDIDTLLLRIESRIPSCPTGEALDPLDGDVGIWRETLELLRAVAMRLQAGRTGDPPGVLPSL